MPRALRGVFGEADPALLVTLTIAGAEETRRSVEQMSSMSVCTCRVFNVFPQLRTRAGSFDVLVEGAQI